MKRNFALMMAIVFIMGIFATIPAGALVLPVAPEASVVAVSADTYVNSNKPDVAYGEEKYTFLRPNSGRFPLFKFDISAIRENLNEYIEIESASVSLYATGTGSNLSGAATVNAHDTQLYYVADDSWEETTQLTYNNMPARGDVISDTVTIAAGVSFTNENGALSYDVTEAVKAEVAKADDSYLSCALDGNNYINETIGFIAKKLADDKNYAQYGPKLTVTYRVKQLLPETSVVAVSADTYVNSSKPDVAYGEEKYTFLRPNSGRFPFFKFDISGIRENINEFVEIESASVSLYATGTGSNLGGAATVNAHDTQLYYVADDSWEETTQLTYNNMPARGDVISDTVTIAAGVSFNNANGALSYDVTEAVKAEVAKAGDNYLSCALDGENYINETIGFIAKKLADDKNYAQYGPKLTVTYKIKDLVPEDVAEIAIEDTYVANNVSASGVDEKEINYGEAIHLVYKQSARYAFLKFDISDIRKNLTADDISIRNAKIRLSVIGSDRYGKNTPTTADVDVRAYAVSDDTWVEGTGDRNGTVPTDGGMTYNTIPSVGAGISNAVKIPAGTLYSEENAPYVELDITEALLSEKDDILSVAINGDTYVNANIFFFSTENGVSSDLAPTLYVDYAKKEEIATNIASETLTIDGEYIHGYADDETVTGLVSKIILPAEGATAEVYNGDVLVNASSKVAQGMKLRVTSQDATKTADYTICNGELFVGTPEYLLSGVQSDGTYKDTSINITIPAINYTNNVKKLSIAVARYNDGKLENIVAYDKEITAKFDNDITETYTEEGTFAKTVSYKVFVWEKDSLEPKAASQLYSSEVAGKNVVVFGDSISAPNDGYVKLLKDATGANLTNAAVAGARIISGSDGRMLDGYGINLQTIVGGLCAESFDWSLQESYKESTSGSEHDKANIDNFSTINLSETDAAIIWMGTNDYGSNVNLADFEVAVKDVLDKLTAKNANMKIVLASPIYRSRISGTDGKNSDEYPNGNGVYLTDFCNVLKEVAADYNNVTFLDLYNDSGIRKFSDAKYIYLPDGVHPAREDGRANKIVSSLFAQKLAEVLK